MSVPSTADLAVCGGGASGLTAAIAAARQGLSVVILEAAEIAGAKILSTGNGRCNLANQDLDPAHYNAPSFVARVMGAHPLEAILEFFEGLGLATCTEGDRLYPQSRQAASVHNLLLLELRRLGVTVAPLREVLGVHPAKAKDGSSFHWAVDYRDATLRPRTGTPDPLPTPSLKASAVLWAAGGGAFAALDGLSLARTPLQPVLCGLLCEPSPLDELNGRKAQGSLTLLRQGQPIAAKQGEVLLRAGGLSGPEIFDLSRMARPNDEILLNLLPGLNRPEILRYLERWLFFEGELSEHALDGLLDPAIGRLLVRLARHGWPVPADSVLESLAALTQRLPFTVTGFDRANAQVTRGGIARSAVDPATMAISADAKGHALPPGLFGSGEALDVDGPCGGYNLAFAWLSGIKAGRSAAALVRRIKKGGAYD